eukprot:gene450-811_t
MYSPKPLYSESLPPQVTGDIIGELLVRIRKLTFLDGTVPVGFKTRFEWWGHKRGSITLPVIWRSGVLGNEAIFPLRASQEVIEQYLTDMGKLNIEVLDSKSMVVGKVQVSLIYLLEADTLIDDTFNIKASRGVKKKVIGSLNLQLKCKWNNSDSSQHINAPQLNRFHLDNEPEINNTNKKTNSTNNNSNNIPRGPLQSSFVRNEALAYTDDSNKFLEWPSISKISNDEAKFKISNTNILRNPEENTDKLQMTRQHKKNVSIPSHDNNATSTSTLNFNYDSEEDLDSETLQDQNSHNHHDHHQHSRNNNNVTADTDTTTSNTVRSQLSLIRNRGMAKREGSGGGRKRSLSSSSSSFRGVGVPSEAVFIPNVSKSKNIIDADTDNIIKTQTAGQQSQQQHQNQNHGHGHKREGYRPTVSFRDQQLRHTEIDWLLRGVSEIYDADDTALDDEAVERLLKQGGLPPSQLIFPTLHYSAQKSMNKLNIIKALRITIQNIRIHSCRYGIRKNDVINARITDWRENSSGKYNHNNSSNNNNNDYTGKGLLREFFVGNSTVNTTSTWTLKLSDAVVGEWLANGANGGSVRIEIYSYLTPIITKKKQSSSSTSTSTSTPAVLFGHSIIPLSGLLSTEMLDAVVTCVFAAEPNTMEAVKNRMDSFPASRSSRTIATKSGSELGPSLGSFTARLTLLENESDLIPDAEITGMDTTPPAPAPLSIPVSKSTSSSLAKHDRPSEQSVSERVIHDAMDYVPFEIRRVPVQDRTETETLRTQNLSDRDHWKQQQMTSNNTNTDTGIDAGDVSGYWAVAVLGLDAVDLSSIQGLTVQQFTEKTALIGVPITLSVSYKVQTCDKNSLRENMSVNTFAYITDDNKTKTATSPGQFLSDLSLLTSRIYPLTSFKDWRPPVFEVWLEWITSPPISTPKKILLGLARWSSKLAFGEETVLDIIDPVRGTSRGHLICSVHVQEERIKAEKALHDCMNMYSIQRSMTRNSYEFHTSTTDKSDKNTLMSNFNEKQTKEMRSHTYPPMLSSDPVSVSVQDDNNNNDNDNGFGNNNHIIPDESSILPIENMQTINNFSSNDLKNDNNQYQHHISGNRSRSDNVIIENSNTSSSSSTVRRPPVDIILDLSVRGCMNLSSLLSLTSGDFLGAFVCYSLAAGRRRGNVAGSVSTVPRQIGSGTQTPTDAFGESCLWWDNNCNVLNSSNKHHIPANYNISIFNTDDDDDDDVHTDHSDNGITFTIILSDTEGGFPLSSTSTSTTNSTTGDISVYILGEAHIPLSRWRELLISKSAASEQIELDISLSSQFKALKNSTVSIPEGFRLVLSVEHRCMPVSMSTATAMATSGDESGRRFLSPQPAIPVVRNIGRSASSNTTTVMDELSSVSNYMMEVTEKTNDNNDNDNNSGDELSSSNIIQPDGTESNLRIDKSESDEWLVLKPSSTMRMTSNKQPPLPSSSSSVFVLDHPNDDSNNNNRNINVYNDNDQERLPLIPLDTVSMSVSVSVSIEDLSNVNFPLINGAYIIICCSILPLSDTDNWSIAYNMNMKGDNMKIIAVVKSEKFSNPDHKRFISKEIAKTIDLHVIKPILVGCKSDNNNDKDKNKSHSMSSSHSIGGYALIIHFYLRPPWRFTLEIGDQLLASGVVDLTPLTRGFPCLHGWYHLMDNLQHCQGQIKLQITCMRTDGFKEQNSYTSLTNTTNENTLQSNTIHDFHHRNTNMTTSSTSAYPRQDFNFEMKENHNVLYTNNNHNNDNHNNNNRPLHLEEPSSSSSSSRRLRQLVESLERVRQQLSDKSTKNDNDGNGNNIAVIVNRNNPGVDEFNNDTLLTNNHKKRNGDEDKDQDHVEYKYDYDNDYEEDNEDEVEEGGHLSKALSKNDDAYSHSIRITAARSTLPSNREGIKKNLKQVSYNGNNDGNYGKNGSENNNSDNNDNVDKLYNSNIERKGHMYEDEYEDDVFDMIDEEKEVGEKSSHSHRQYDNHNHNNDNDDEYNDDETDIYEEYDRQRPCDADIDADVDVDSKDRDRMRHGVHPTHPRLRERDRVNNKNDFMDDDIRDDDDDNIYSEDYEQEEFNGRRKYDNNNNIDIDKEHSENEDEVGYNSNDYKGNDNNNDDVIEQQSSKKTSKNNKESKVNKYNNNNVESDVNVNVRNNPNLSSKEDDDEEEFEYKENGQQRSSEEILYDSDEEELELFYSMSSCWTKDKGFILNTNTNTSIEAFASPSPDVDTIIVQENNDIVVVDDNIDKEQSNVNVIGSRTDSLSRIHFDEVSSSRSWNTVRDQKRVVEECVVKNDDVISESLSQENKTSSGTNDDKIHSISYREKEDDYDDDDGRGDSYIDGSLDYEENVSDHQEHHHNRDHGVLDDAVVVFTGEQCLIPDNVIRSTNAPSVHSDSVVNQTTSSMEVTNDDEVAQESPNNIHQHIPVSVPHVTATVVPVEEEAVHMTDKERMMTAYNTNNIIDDTSPSFTTSQDVVDASVQAAVVGIKDSSVMTESQLIDVAVGAESASRSSPSLALSESKVRALVEEEIKRVMQRQYEEMKESKETVDNVRYSVEGDVEGDVGLFVLSDLNKDWESHPHSQYQQGQSGTSTHDKSQNYAQKTAMERQQQQWQWQWQSSSPIHHPSPPPPPPAKDNIPTTEDIENEVARILHRNNNRETGIGTSVAQKASRRTYKQLPGRQKFLESETDRISRIMMGKMSRVQNFN